jgi:hypothetical protein
VRKEIKKYKGEQVALSNTARHSCMEAFHGVLYLSVVYTVDISHLTLSLTAGLLMTYMTAYSLLQHATELQCFMKSKWVENVLHAVWNFFYYEK